MKYLFFCITTCFLWVQCDQPTPNTTSTSSKSVTQPPASAPPNASITNTKVDTLPSIELAVLESLWETSDFVDYVFYQLPISLSLEEDTSIKRAITHISQLPAGINPACKAIGRIFFQVDGENVLVGDLYFQKGCTSFIWLDAGGKPYAGNQITNEGIQFLQQNFQAAQQRIQPSQGH